MAAIQASQTICLRALQPGRCVATCTILTAALLSALLLVPVLIPELSFPTVDRPAQGGGAKEPRRLASEAREPSAPEPCPKGSEADRPWCNVSLPLDHRVDLLMRALHDDELPALVSDDLFSGTIGVPRLGVPKYSWVNEADHGMLKVNVTPMPTAFPQVISMAATFNRTLFRAVGKATALEARALFEAGLMDGLLLHTNINIFRDPRWGRGQETPGEDPMLSAAYAGEWVAGIQSTYGPQATLYAAAACKHFVAYSYEGSPPMTRHNFNAEVTAQDFADTYQLPFEACVRAGAKGIMCSYNQVNGTPTCASPNLLEGLVRRSWQFQGLVVTDCDSVEDMFSQQHFVPSRSEAVAAALSAGTDIDCGNTYKKYFQPDMLPMVRKAVGRSLRVRMQLGEFDGETGRPDNQVASSMEEHSQLSLEAALQSAVLLKNSQEVLPLAVGARVAVLGPLANATTLLQGDYSARPVKVTTALEGLQRYASRVDFQPGVRDVCATDTIPGVQEPPPDVDAVVIVAGLLSEDYDELDPEKKSVKEPCTLGCLEAEGCDRPSLAWPHGQEELIRLAASWGKPTVLVIASGGPLDLSNFAADPGVGSILWLGYPGPHGGDALAEILFGKVSPSGRLSQTFYTGSFTAAAPMSSMALRPGQGTPGRTHRFVEDRYIQYPFGTGLSYAKFDYQWLGHRKQLLDPSEVGGGKLPFRVTRRDHLPIEASLVVLVFLRPPASAGPGAPKRELRRFERLRLRPASGVDVSFDLRVEDFMLADEAGQWQVAKGQWLVQVGEPAQLSLKMTVGQGKLRQELVA